MTPTLAESPLRKSEVGAYRTPVQTTVINDDDAERKEGRSRSGYNSSLNTSSVLEENETVKNCLKIFQENKLSRENAWQMSLIDTLAHLFEKHHKSVNSFKVVSSSLEASSKVYSLRVDSIHIDVVRLCSDLNKKKFVQPPEDEDENVAETAPGDQEKSNDEACEPPVPKKRKRARKQVSTITKNKETINARLDTNPFTDAIFAKLNSIVGGFNSSSRLLQNVLPSLDSELRLRMDYKFWDSSDKEPNVYSDVYDYSQQKMVNASHLERMKTDNMLLRTTHSGYKILDVPADQDSDDDVMPASPLVQENYLSSQMAMAFDMNAEVEPIPTDAEVFMDVDMDQLDNLTNEDHVAINNCKTLRRTAITLDDMRPVDASSATLEYSYRPLDKISQFWAGPSHWKFKKTRTKSMSIGQRFSSLHEQNEKQHNKRGRKKNTCRSRNLHFGQIHDELFQKLDSKTKMRKANIQKTWDYKKLKLPTDLHIDKTIFDVFQYAPSLVVHSEVNDTISLETPENNSYDYNNPVDEQYCSNTQNDDYIDNEPNMLENENDIPCTQNQTIVEIATDFDGAPEKVTKIVVPFAKRAKVVDMKQLKKRCLQEIHQELNETVNMVLPPPSAEMADENYIPGEASFVHIYRKLPQMLTPNLAEALSPAIAFYAILHLANETPLRLLKQEDLNDFKIRKLDNQN